MDNYQLTIEQSNVLKRYSSRPIVWDIKTGEVIWRGSEHFLIEDSFKEASVWFADNDKRNMAMTHG